MTKCRAGFATNNIMWNKVRDSTAGKLHDRSHAIIFENEMIRDLKLCFMQGLFCIEIL